MFRARLRPHQFRRFTLNFVLIVLALTLNVFGSGCKKEVVSAATPTPTPEPDSPTPEPAVYSEYRTRSFAIASADQGFDLDGDGAIDNNLPAVLDTLNTVLYDAIYDACYLIQPSSAQICTDTIWNALENNGLILNVAALNAAIASGIADGSINYLELLDGTSSDISLYWYEGYSPSVGLYTTDYSLGSQSGTLAKESRRLAVGPGTFIYQFSEGYNLHVTEVYTNALYIAADEAAGTKSSLEGGLLGGAVTQSSIEQFIRDIVPSSLDSYEEQIVVEVMDALVALNLFDLTVSGEPAFSCAFTFASDEVEISNHPTSARLP